MDDYSYDWCSDAIREGYAYQIIAYDDEVYSYAQIVFTGLPIVCMNTQEAIPEHVDVSGLLTMSYDHAQGMESRMRTHKRGATSLRTEGKVGYKIELTRNADGSGKVALPVRGFGETDSFILIPPNDPTMMQVRLSWDVYALLAPKEEPFGARDVFYVEVFINDRYQGVYLAMNPYDYVQELRKESASAVETDCIYRLTITQAASLDRRMYFGEHGLNYEEYYIPAQYQDQVFAPLEDFAQAYNNAYPDDGAANAAYGDALMRCMDVDSVLWFSLFTQGCNMDDNIFNNMYVWAQRRQNGFVYRIFPWDMDVAWVQLVKDFEDQDWEFMPLLDRAIEQDCGGVIRSKVRQIWPKMREMALNEETLTRLLEQYAYELGESGAFQRDAARWGSDVYYPDGYNILSYALMRFDMMDARIEEMTDEALQGRRLRIEPYETLDAGELDAVGQ